MFEYNALAEHVRLPEAHLKPNGHDNWYADMDNRLDNLEFIYVQFACRGKEDHSIGRIPFLSPSNVAHWKEVTQEDDEALEELYLYSYMFGFKVGQEGRCEKYRHYIFTGPKGEGENEGADSFLDALLRTCRESEPNSLFDLRRKLREKGPICDGGARHLQGTTLGSALFGLAADGALLDGKLPTCDCWRIRKAHRYPSTPLEYDADKGWGQIDEDDQDRWSFLFDIRRVHCYRFSTGVAILAFELSFRIPETKPQTSISDWVASGMFHLKKVENVSILPVDSNRYREEPQEKFAKGLPEGLSFCNLGKLLASDLLGVRAEQDADCGRPYLFFHAPANVYKDGTGDNEHDADAGGSAPTITNSPDDDHEIDVSAARRKSVRANSLVYVAEQETTAGIAEDEIVRRLFYLANCFDVNIPYLRESHLQPQSYIDSPDIRWGFTPESFACLTTYGKSQKKPYVMHEFRDHFRFQYQFVYVLLLHQKYYYYLLLSEIGSPASDIDSLRQHQEKLQRFNANFTFSRITEVAQYQQVYQAGATVMGLEQLKQDVREPLEQLITAQEKQAADKQEINMRYITLFGIVIALVSCISVVTDVATFIEMGSGRAIAAGVLFALVACTCIAFLAIVHVPNSRSNKSRRRE